MTKQTALAEREPAQLAATEDASVSMFERLATDPNVSVEKIERMMALWERVEAKKAAMAFGRAMTAAQKAMRSVAADAHNPQTKSRYASYEALDRALRPIYTEHGFGMSFNTGVTDKPDHVRILCDVTHDGGHSKEYHIDMPADGKGAKGGDVMTKTHATGSAASYGMRYLLKMIWNVAVGEGDDDGNAAGGYNKSDPPPVPVNYDRWLHDLTAVADNGLAELQKAWTETREEYKRHLVTTNPKLWNDLKIKAAKVKGGR